MSPSSSHLHQLSFPELDFEGRTVVTTGEIALKWRCTDRHVRNVLGNPRAHVEEGSLAMLDIRAPQSSVACPRVPISSYRTFIATRFSGATREQLLALLPIDDLRGLVADANRAIKRKTAAA